MYNDFYFFPLELVYSVLSIFYCTAGWPSDPSMHTFFFPTLSRSIINDQTESYNINNHFSVLWNWLFSGFSISLNNIIIMPETKIQNPNITLTLSFLTYIKWDKNQWKYRPLSASANTFLCFLPPVVSHFGSKKSHPCTITMSP